LGASPLLIVAVVSFLLGSIPFGYLLVRIFCGVDVRKTGSGNIGATNVARTGSKGLAIATLVLDALKGYVAVIFAFQYTRPPVAMLAAYSGLNAVSMPPALRYTFVAAALAGLCAVLGHMFTPWLGFKGGKGVATAVGAFAALAPRAVLVALLLFVVVVAITRYVSLGSMLGAIVFPFAAWWLSPFMRTSTVMLLVALASLLIIIRHKDNIRRLLAGTESRFGAQSKPA
jgi:glycerol-3-phosphate acyltransferase PlsY